MVRLVELFEREEILLEMPKLNKNFVGLPYPVWMFKVGGQHSGRVKIGNHVNTRTSKFDCFLLDLSKEPKVPKSSTQIKTEDLAKMKKWVSFNSETLKKMDQTLENEEGKFKEIEKMLIPFQKIIELEQEMKNEIKPRKS